MGWNWQVVTGLGFIGVLLAITFITVAFALSEILIDSWRDRDWFGVAYGIGMLTFMVAMMLLLWGMIAAI